MPTVYGRKQIVTPATKDRMLNKNIGLMPRAYKSVNIYCPAVVAIAPQADIIPKPVPLKGKGNISVTYKKVIAK